MAVQGGGGGDCLQKGGFKPTHYAGSMLKKFYLMLPKLKQFSLSFRHKSKLKMCGKKLYPSHHIQKYIQMNTYTGKLMFKAQLCKLYSQKYIIVSTQIANTSVFHSQLFYF